MDKVSKKTMNEVQGGGDYWVTNMSCSKCGYSTSWLGSEFYFKQQTYECPSCHNNTLTGTGIAPGGIK